MPPWESYKVIRSESEVPLGESLTAGEEIQMGARSVSVSRMVSAVVLMLLAVSNVADACSNAASPGFRAYLPDCRAYELVSPGYKEGFPVFAAGISGAGSQLQLRMESLGSFSNPENTGSIGLSYLAVRTDSGWNSSPLDVPFSTFPIYLVQGMSSDFQNSLWFASVPGQTSRDVYLGQPDNLMTRMGPGAPHGIRESGLIFVGASDNLQHVLLRDISPRGGEEDRLWPGDTTVGGRKRSLYEYEGFNNSEPRLVGVSNEGVPASIAASKLISNCGTTLGSSPSPGGDAYDAVSADGTNVFFTAVECGGAPFVNEVYVRRDGGKPDAETVAISEPSKKDCRTCETFEDVPENRSAAVFQGASRDGSKVFFLSEQKLLPGAENDNLYMYNFHPEEEGRKADEKVSLVAPMMTPSGGKPGGMARVSEDGSHVYFVSEGVLAGANREGKSPEQGAPNMYVFVSGCLEDKVPCATPIKHLAFIAKLTREDSDEEDWRSDDVRPVQTTPTGSFIIFKSVDELTGTQGGREAGQIFEYDAETEVLQRISRGENGYNQDGNSQVYSATIPVQAYEGSTPEGHFNQLAISEDGSRVFFSSADALTPQALNGICIYMHEGVCASYANNIYEYHDGQISLISDGRDVASVNQSAVAELLETDSSGRDVLFTTGDRLVPQDTDTQVDIYDAREDGGFPQFQNEESAQCEENTCQGTAATEPSLLAPLTPIVAAETTNPGSDVTALTKSKMKTKKKPKGHKHKKRNAKPHKAKTLNAGR
jgi:hypothetical protein